MRVTYFPNFTHYISDQLGLAILLEADFSELYADEPELLRDKGLRKAHVQVMLKDAARDRLTRAVAARRSAA